MKFVYPFTSVLDIMKPSKINPDNKNHVAKLKECMHSPLYRWEEKLDGISILAIGGRLFSNKISKETGWPGEKTEHMPQVSIPLQQLGEYLILDGEAYREGWKSNQVTSITNTKDIPTALAKQAERGNLQLWVYDILRDVDGTWLINEPYEKRRARLEELFATEPALQRAQDIVLNEIHNCATDDVEVALADILSRGLEGVVMKRIDGVYSPGKRPMWVQLKLKATFDDDVIITGFLPATKKYTGKNIDTWPYWEDGEPVSSNYAQGLIGSIKIGKFDNHGELVDMGSVTGITDELRRDMTENPNKYIGQVITIRGMERTEDGMYRHANFRSFHADKNPEECKLTDIPG